MNDSINLDVVVWVVGLPLAVLWLWVCFRWLRPATGKPITRRQPFSGRKIILLCGATAFVLCGLFPPWLSISYQGHTRSADYRFILSPSPKEGNTYGTRLDISRLAVECSPWSVPPAGFSTFPTDEAEQMDVAMQVLRLPEKFESFDGAKEFLEYARKFEDAGFLIVAVDNKTKLAIRYACKAIEELPRSIRKADMGLERIAYLPADISDADRQAVEEKHQQRTFTKADLDELWRKYRKPRTSLNSPWNKIEEARPMPMHKRERAGKLVEEKLFNFAKICRELEQIDSGLVPKGDFVQRLRL